MSNIVPVISSSVSISIQETRDEFRNSTLEEHRRILAAILRRDYTGARFCMAAHLNTSRDHFARRVWEQEKEAKRPKKKPPQDSPVA